jgi:hypothetical protein
VESLRELLGCGADDLGIGCSEASSRLGGIQRRAEVLVQRLHNWTRRLRWRPDAETHPDLMRGVRIEFVIYEGKSFANDRALARSMHAEYRVSMRKMRSKFLSAADGPDPEASCDAVPVPAPVRARPDAPRVCARFVEEVYSCAERVNGNDVYTAICLHGIKIEWDRYLSQQAQETT